MTVLVVDHAVRAVRRQDGTLADLEGSVGDEVRVYGPTPTTGLIEVVQTGATGIAPAYALGETDDGALYTVASHANGARLIRLEGVFQASASETLRFTDQRLNKAETLRLSNGNIVVGWDNPSTLDSVMTLLDPDGFTLVGEHRLNVNLSAFRVRTH